MISAKILAKTAEKFILDNAPAIMTGIGVVGAIGTTYLTGKASFRAARKIEDEKAERRMMSPGPKIDYAPLPAKDALLLIWPEFIPPAVSLGVTITSIICAQHVSAKRAAALVAAYSLSEKRFAEYKEKVIEKINPKQEQKIIDEIAQDHVTKNPPSAQIMVVGEGQILCYDEPSGRYFHSDMETIRRVMNDINQQVNVFGYASLSDLQVRLGMDTTIYSEELGWTQDKMLEIQFSSVLAEDKKPCLVMNYALESIRGYVRSDNTEAPF